MSEQTGEKTDSIVRILVVDDHDIVRRGLVMLMSRREEFNVVGEAGTMEEAIARSKELFPNVVVMDIRLPDGTGIEACHEIRDFDPNIKVLMLTSYSDEEAVMGAIMAGASGYLLKEIRSQEILDAVSYISKGKSLLDPEVTAKVLDRVRRGNVKDERWNQLTEHEREIIELIAKGKTNKEISEEVHLSDKTVKNYVSNILSKLEVNRRAQAAAYMAERKTRREFAP